VVVVLKVQAPLAELAELMLETAAVMVVLEDHILLH
jgi:hypothetical protein